MKFNTLFVLPFLLIPIFLIPHNAKAEGNCPPGMYPIGGGNAGWHGCAPMNGGIEEDYDGESDYDTGYDYGYKTPYTIADWEYLKQYLSAEQKAEKAKQEALRKKLEAGYWEPLDFGKKVKKGEFCGQLWINIDGMMSINGPGGSYKGALIVFSGPNIPKPAKPKQMKVTLRQTDSKDQTVSVFNQTHPKTKMGMIVFASPKIETVLDGLIDSASFEVISGSKSLVKISYKNGFLARDEIKKCLKG